MISEDRMERSPLISKLVSDVEGLIEGARASGRRQVRLCQDQMTVSADAPHATDDVVQALVTTLRNVYPCTRMQFDGRQCGYVVVVDF